MGEPFTSHAMRNMTDKAIHNGKFGNFPDCAGQLSTFQSLTL